MKKYPMVIVCASMAILFAACSDTEDTTTSVTSAATESTTTTAVATTAAPATTTAAPETTAAPVTTTAPPETTTTAAPTTTTTLPPFPAERVSLQHGGEAWVVILASAAEFDDPALDAAVAAAEAAGYTAGPTDCDRGAAAALGLPEEASVITVSVYLESEEDAQAALAAFEARGVDGALVATVLTYCLD